MSEMSDRIRAMNIGCVGTSVNEIIIPENVECRDDLQYGSDPKWNVFDIYYETSNEKKHPTLISIHGGGWVSNTKESYRHYCLDLARRGFNVVNFTFRLAPEDKHPAMIEDVNSLVTHLLEHGEEYGLDTKNVFMLGDSAGAHMLNMFAAICTNPEYAATFPFTAPAGFVPTAIALNCGVYSFDKNTGKDGRPSLILDYVGTEDVEYKLQQITSIDYVNADFPPTFVMTANADVFQDQYANFDAKLTEMGVEHISKKYGMDDNKLGHVFHLDIYQKDAIECNDEQCAFFMKYYQEP